MDAGIGMMIFVIIIANVGGIYFYLQDKKEFGKAKKGSVN